jgi:hypothetical protein
MEVNLSGQRTGVKQPLMTVCPCLLIAALLENRKVNFTPQYHIEWMMIAGESF